jgi:hypothetical protein
MDRDTDAQDKAAFLPEIKFTVSASPLHAPTILLTHLHISRSHEVVVHIPNTD